MESAPKEISPSNIRLSGYKGHFFMQSFKKFHKDIYFLKATVFRNGQAEIFVFYSHHWYLGSSYQNYQKYVIDWPGLRLEGFLRRPHFVCS